jgi:hypothetical protein
LPPYSWCFRLGCGFDDVVAAHSDTAMRDVKKNTSKGVNNKEKPSQSFEDKLEQLVAGKRKAPQGALTRITA